MSEEADQDGEAREQRSGDVGSLILPMGVMADEIDEDRQNGQPDEDIAPVNGYATAPLAQIIAFRFEDKPLVSEK